MQHILGISAFYHDSAACLITDGRIVAAAQEERFTRKKHDESFPLQAVKYCLREGGIDSDKLDGVAFYDKPFLKFERILETYLEYAPRGLWSFVAAMPVWIKKKLWIKAQIQSQLRYSGPVYFTQHHEAHAASAFYPSPFNESAFLTVDGVGEWATTSFGVGKGSQLDIKADISFPHSLGLLYSAFTYYTGFKVNSGEYKLMGLAPYGSPVFTRLIRDELIDIKNDGSFHLNMKYFNYGSGLTMTNKLFGKLFGGPPRTPESPLTQREMDLAASIQEVTNEVMLKMAHHVKNETGQKNLCLAGGVALNCVANGLLAQEGLFDRIWIQPAAGDAGGALGAALAVWHKVLKAPRQTSQNNMNVYCGPSYLDDEIENMLRARSIPYQKLDKDSLLKTIARRLAEGAVVGWFQGRMEFGPRALGNRSILGDPRNRDMQKNMNLKIKFRESFRPFAPAVLYQDAREYFELPDESPYMLLVAPVAKKHRFSVDGGVQGLAKVNQLRSDIPAVTHVDYSARVQTVHKDMNPLFYELLEAFKRETGCPLLINTSFNVRGEPIVCTPEDAFRCFMRTNMDYLVMGGILIEKKSSPAENSDKSWQEEFELD